MLETGDKQVIYHTCWLGCDPELFFEKGGQIIGAERVVSEEGLSDAKENSTYGKKKAFVLDGVQIEMNPNPSHCRANLSNELRVHFHTLRDHLKGMKGVTASFRSVVEVNKTELDGLSDKAKALGCAPSHNLYDNKATVTVNGAEYNKRSAGGHIHVGMVVPKMYSHMKFIDRTALLPYREELVPLMDCFVGLPSVFVDRDPLASERRKVYGRAGEYRLPDHGLEYRTLSNFWLRSVALMSMFMGLSRLALSVLGTKYFADPHGTEYYLKMYAPGGAYNKDSLAGSGKYYEDLRDRSKNALWDAPGELLKNVDLPLVQRAINENDLTLATEAFEPVRAFIERHVRTGEYGLNAGLLPAFDTFVAEIQKKGIEYWFPQDPIEHWCNAPEGHYSTGAESFLGAVLRGRKPGTVFDGKHNDGYYIGGY